MSQQPPVNSSGNAGALIAGIVVGLLIGGSGLALMLFLVFLLVTSSLKTSSQWIPFVLNYVVGIGIAVAGITAVRRHTGFVSGMIVGLAAGLLGGTALCNVLVGGLNNMH